ncbi:four-carbon acid sugar kinase family protein [Clostridium formicaceticum]|uniref:Serine kinase n=1 Tax=Clostridium formicaceticum TaxID=1497 RepID=A0AAC9RQ68_9CLOT|nr:four-carbon acid sugar kinase family protein [Clostridium formicaceticum]AOY75299.1 hypothetical protein BJL90_04890 [Clostridium formicaceticum]ARE89739.1 hypothetical protein CLFO_42200 [Clostridium formicaceticum]
MNKKLAIIADDFTGSNDTGVQFTKKGLKTGVLTNIDNIKEALEDLDVVVVDTESRFDAKEIAYEKVNKVAKVLQANQIDYIYKKLDSTLRGNIGAEIEAVMQATETNLAIVVPSLPKNGRTVVGGIQLVQHVPLEKTEFAKDPMNPVHYSYIPDIIALQTDRKIGIIHLQNVLKGPEAIMEKIKKFAERGIEIIVIDAISSEDLINISTATAGIEKKLIFAGSAGLAEFLPDALGIVRKDTLKMKKGNVVVVAGSVSDITRAQVNFAAKDPSVEVIDINIKNAFDHPKEEKIRIMKMIDNYIKEEKDVIIRSAKTRKDVEYARQVGREKGWTNNDISREIAEFLGEVTKDLCKKLKIKGLLLTGGDIAIKAARLMEVSGTLIEDELLPAIPVGKFISKEYGHIAIVTKAGGFGEEDAISKIIASLKKG